MPYIVFVTFLSGFSVNSQAHLALNVFVMFKGILPLYFLYIGYLAYNQPGLSFMS